ncbi:hypothetical protein LSAT2_027420 [Lamellibrachia satsuma]|nr:hypothetical protein LSAT2_027420 [Lamellibrachia satsuma]
MTLFRTDIAANPLGLKSSTGDLWENTSDKALNARTRARAHPRTRAPAHPRTRAPAHTRDCGYGADDSCVKKFKKSAFLVLQTLVKELQQELATTKAGFGSPAMIKQCSRRDLNDGRERGVLMPTTVTCSKYGRATFRATEGLFSNTRRYKKQD